MNVLPILPPAPAASAVPPGVPAAVPAGGASSGTAPASPFEAIFGAVFQRGGEEAPDGDLDAAFTALSEGAADDWTAEVESCLASCRPAAPSVAAMLAARPATPALAGERGEDLQGALDPEVAVTSALVEDDPSGPVVASEPVDGGTVGGGPVGADRPDAVDTEAAGDADADPRPPVPAAPSSSSPSAPSTDEIGEAADDVPSTAPEGRATSEPQQQDRATGATNTGGRAGDVRGPRGLDTPGRTIGVDGDVAGRDRPVATERAAAATISAGGGPSAAAASSVPASSAAAAAAQDPPAADVAASVLTDRGAAGRADRVDPGTAASIARVLDAIEQLEHAPPPRQLTLELGELRVRLALEDGAVRLQLLGEQRDAGRELLRAAADELRARGYDLGDGARSDARGDRGSSAGARDDRPGRSGPTVPPTEARRRSSGDGVHL
jgi:hypothetical protein